MKRIAYALTMLFAIAAAGAAPNIVMILAEIEQTMEKHRATVKPPKNPLADPPAPVQRKTTAK